MMIDAQKFWGGSSKCFSPLIKLHTQIPSRSVLLGNVRQVRVDFLFRQPLEPPIDPGDVPDLQFVWLEIGAQGVLERADGLPDRLLLGRGRALFLVVVLVRVLVVFRPPESSPRTLKG